VSQSQHWPNRFRILTLGGFGEFTILVVGWRVVVW
jgi:hypothetical protein